MTHQTLHRSSKRLANGSFPKFVKSLVHNILCKLPIRPHIANSRGTDTMNDSRTIANRFLALAKERGDALTPMQLLKLVYIAHGWMLGLYGRPLIQDRVEAWQYGPVIPVLYNALRGYKGDAVTLPVKAPAGDILDDKERDIICQVYDMYGSKSGPALSRLTHAAGTPWERTYVAGEFGVVIPTDIIEDHYQRLAAK